MSERVMHSGHPKTLPLILLSKLDSEMVEGATAGPIESSAEAAVLDNAGAC
jgi:hypothetical protein